TVLEAKAVTGCILPARGAHVGDARFALLVRRAGNEPHLLRETAAGRPGELVDHPAGELGNPGTRPRIHECDVVHGAMRRKPDRFRCSCGHKSGQCAPCKPCCDQSRSNAHQASPARIRRTSRLGRKPHTVDAACKVSTLTSTRMLFPVT